MTRRTGSAIAKLAAATLIFAFNPLIFGAIQVPPLEVLWTVSALGAVLLGAWLVATGRGGEVVACLRTRWRTIGLLAVAFSCNNVLYIWSVKTTTVANAVLTHYAAPLFVFGLGAVFLHERIERRSIVAVGVALAGLVLLLNPAALSVDWRDRQTLGIALGLGSAVFYAAEIVLKKQLVTHTDALVAVVAYLIAGVVLMGVFVDWRGWIAMPAHDALLLGVSGIGAAGIGNALFMSGLRDVRAQQAGVISYIEPLGAIVLGFAVLHEVPTAWTFAGGALILGATALVASEPPPADPINSAHDR